MKFQFEKFIQTSASFDAKATIRQKTGQIGFSAGAVNRFEIGKFSHAVLYFDRESRVIGIKLVEAEEEGAIPINSRPSNTYLTAKNFLDKYAVDYSKSHRHELEVDEESGLLFLSADADEQAEENEVEENESSEGNYTIDIEDMF